MQKLPQLLTLNKYAAKNNLELILYACQVQQCFYLNLGSLHSIISLKCGIALLFSYSNKNNAVAKYKHTHYSYS